MLGSVLTQSKQQYHGLDKNRAQNNTKQNKNKCTAIKIPLSSGNRYLAGSYSTSPQIDEPVTFRDMASMVIACSANKLCPPIHHHPIHANAPFVTKAMVLRMLSPKSQSRLQRGNDKKRTRGVRKAKIEERQEALAPEARFPMGNTDTQNSLPV
ncbi:hypothetical protein N658DRAFT_50436 [Parathielavia hyrcaniae]|uniref:Uncharacterized protein n=1 Tax=Parathielavia hyrcaniae TaxID=113614 RepID=A0AAN6T1T1_9PEZI|nr:hypothetical protein N658DRAFT_50436 [Parathielavia hyrcaniae]